MSLAQLVEAMRYSRKVTGSISDTVIKNFRFQTHYGPGVDSDPKRNEYQEHFLEGEV